MRKYLPPIEPYHIQVKGHNDQQHSDHLKYIRMSQNQPDQPGYLSKLFVLDIDSRTDSEQFYLRSFLKNQVHPF